MQNSVSWKEVIIEAHRVGRSAGSSRVGKKEMGE